MSKLFLPVLLLALALPAIAGARPERLDELPRIHRVHTQPRMPQALGVQHAAAAGTTFFGGTFWAADSGRWEAIQDSVWTFDTGVGSHFDHSAPYVDPYKDLALHAYMEGWVGLDLTSRNFGQFRRLSESDFTGPDVCVGDLGGLGGDWSFWCGALPEEADALCYAGGQGYGENWDICLEQNFVYTGGNVTLEYDYVHETETDFDFVYLSVDSLGGIDHEIQLLQYHGQGSGTETLILTQGAELPYETGGEIAIRFCFVSDAAYSDQDGSFVTDCGAFAVDDISITGGGISHFADFETGEDGWILGADRPGSGGEWSRLADLSELPGMLTPCDCSVADSVLLFEDLDVGGHNLFTDNIAISPWVDLLAAGREGSPGKVIAFDFYSNTTLLNYFFGQTHMQWYPEPCPATGGLILSPLTGTGFIIFFGNGPLCSTPAEGLYLDEFSTIAAVGAEQVRIGVGVVSFCRFFADCTNFSNSTPWFDNVKLGVFGVPDTPFLSAMPQDLPQDAFPESGLLIPSHPGRVDRNFLANGITEDSLGDTLIVRADSGTPGTEVYVQFAVRPGPGTQMGQLTAWLAQHQFEETKYGLDWYSARMDTARRSGTTQPDQWMTAYHEEDPNFSGSQNDTDPDDLPPIGSPTRLANDIFPDDLFTPGTRLQLFYKAKFTAGSNWSTWPDTCNTGIEDYTLENDPDLQGPYLEWECLPSSMEMTEGGPAWNCMLYVDGGSGSGAQPWIEGGLGAVLPYGSNNAENTAWDRFDIQNPDGDGPRFGRPPGTEYGATFTQALGYRAILWDTGFIQGSAFFRDEDADILRLYLISTGDNRYLHLAGDDLAASIQAQAHRDPGAQMFLQEFTGTISDFGTIPDTSACYALDPVVAAAASTRPLGEVPATRPGDCPETRSFSVLEPANTIYGTVRAEERYDPLLSGQPGYASISHDAFNGGTFRTLVDGVSLASRRDAGACYAGEPGSVAAIEGRLRESLSWWADPHSVCGPNGLVAAPETPRPGFVTRLLGAGPNPLAAGQPGRIAFSVGAEGRARLEVFDVRGARVATVVDATMPVGEHEAVWHGTDDRGRPVASGVYFYRLSVAGERFSRKLVVVRGGAE